MKQHTLIFLYNLNNRKYLEKLPNKSEISWTDSWIDAYDFTNVFFLFRPFIKLYIEYKYNVNVRWDMVYNYFNKGLI